MKSALFQALCEVWNRCETPESVEREKNYEVYESSFGPLGLTVTTHEGAEYPDQIVVALEDGETVYDSYKEDEATLTLGFVQIVLDAESKLAIQRDLKAVEQGGYNMGRAEGRIEGWELGYQRALEVTVQEIREAIEDGSSLEDLLLQVQSKVDLSKQPIQGVA